MPIPVICARYLNDSGFQMDVIQRNLRHRLRNITNG